MKIDETIKYICFPKTLLFSFFKSFTGFHDIRNKIASNSQKDGLGKLQIKSHDSEEQVDLASGQSSGFNNNELELNVIKSENDFSGSDSGDDNYSDTSGESSDTEEQVSSGESGDLTGDDNSAQLENSGSGKNTDLQEVEVSAESEDSDLAKRSAIPEVQDKRGRYFTFLKQRICLD